MDNPALAEPRREDGRYAPILQVLHWSLALLFTLQIALMLAMHQMQSLEMGRAILALHRTCGVAILLVVLARIFAQAWVRPPAAPKGLPGWQTLTAHLVHGLMILGLVLQPLLGMATAWSRGDEISILGVIRLPALIVLTDAAAVQVETAHACLAYGLTALVGLHLGAIAFNRLVRRASVSERMLPRRPQRRLIDRMSVAFQLTAAFCLLLALTTATGLYSAGQYRASLAMQTRFDETEVASLDELRSAQFAAKQAALLMARGAASDAAGTIKAFAEALPATARRLTDHDGPGRRRGDPEGGQRRCRDRQGGTIAGADVQLRRTTADGGRQSVRPGSARPAGDRAPGRQGT
jgi:cytochrome b561